MQSPYNKSSKSTHKLGTIPSGLLLREKNRSQVYDTSLFHKTIFHLQPLKDNPELYTLAKLNSKSILKRVNTKPTYLLETEDSKTPMKKNIPHPITISQQFTRRNPRQKVLMDSNVDHVTAKKWLIYDMHTREVIKGYKYKKPHDIASLTKILTFYTAYCVIRKYFLGISNFEMIVMEEEAVMKGVNIRLEADDIVTLQDMLYAMMLNSANNAASVLANNLGLYVRKKRRAEYFSCFDVSSNNREENIESFLELMNSHAKELGLSETRVVNPHGMLKNIGSAEDVAKLTAECFKIPLFCKIIATKSYEVRPKFIDPKGECLQRIILLHNSNRLLWQKTGCVGGKTGSNKIGGQCFIGCYEGGISVVVLGSSGTEEKFADCERLMSWLRGRLQ